MHLKMVSVVNFMLCIFYHNFKKSRVDHSALFWLRGTVGCGSPGPMIVDGNYRLEGTLDCISSNTLILQVRKPALK